LYEQRNVNILARK